MFAFLADRYFRDLENLANLFLGDFQLESFFDEEIDTGRVNYCKRSIDECCMFKFAVNLAKHLQDLVNSNLLEFRLKLAENGELVFELFIFSENFVLYDRDFF